MAERIALAVDFGSTFTKLRAVDLSDGRLVATAQSPTTVGEGLLVGLQRGLARLDVPADRIEVSYGCSSAAGGLRIVAVGLVRSLTAEAARLAALGAGGKIIQTFAGPLSRSDMTEIQDLAPDLIVLAGGTDGGDSKCIVGNAGKLAAAGGRAPVIVAGNRSARDDVADAFASTDIEVSIVDNVLPSLDVLDPDACSKYDLKYYVKMAKELEKMGTHILAIKDMAGLCKPYAAHQLVKALRDEVGVPIHFHTHDTSGVNAASILRAADAGVDIVDAAAASMSGLTSQPNLNSIVESLRNRPRDTGLDIDAWNQCSRYWEAARKLYYPFESDMRSGTAEVYLHEMPGGQVTNLREQAKGLGLGERWPEVARAYHQVNELFGDIIKVTPTSKVVGDMAIFMVTNNLTPEDVLDETRQLSFPESVVEFFEGRLGQPYGGFPEKLQKIILRGRKPLKGRPGELLPPPEFDVIKAEVDAKVRHSVGETELLSYLMYPKVMVDFDAHRRQYSDVSVVPTDVFFYGMKPGQETTIEIEAGKTLILKFITVGEASEEGLREVFFELNGQPRNARVQDVSLKAAVPVRPKADPDNPGHVPAPMPGKVGTLAIKVGQEMKKGEKLLSIEAMKMETAVYAPVDGKIKEVHVRTGSAVESRDLLVTLDVTK